MKKGIASILLSAALLTFVSCGNKAGQEDAKEVAEEQNDEKFDDSNKEDDTEFAVEAADGSMFEVQLGQLALTNGTSPQVKEIAQMMITDHGKASEELKTAAQAKNITLPTALSDNKQKKYDDIMAKKGAEFDEAYVDLMVDAHKEDLDKFKEEAEDGKDAELKQWASTKVPVLQHHLEMSQKAQDALKNNKKNG